MGTSKRQLGDVNINDQVLIARTDRPGTDHTRTYDGKDFFTIWDFVRTHENFNDPEWDGEPLPPEEPRPPRPPDEPSAEPEPSEPGTGEDEGGGGEGRAKIVVQLADGKARSIRFIASTTYWSSDGKPISAIEFLARLFGDLSKLIADEDQLRAAWSDPDNRAHLLKQLDDNGYDADRLEDIRQLVDAEQSDLFDVLAYVLFTNQPRTRQDRATTVRDHRMDSFDREMVDLLLGILKAYETNGEGEPATKKLGQFLAAGYGSVSESKGKLGELATVRDAFRRMQIALYAD